MSTEASLKELVALDQPDAAKREDGVERPRVQRIDLYDPNELAKPTTTQEGFLRVDGRISRVGIQIYHDAAGNEHRELRLPEDVFDPESVSSFRMVPVTNTHPSDLLSAQNAKEHVVGSVGENIRPDGDFLAASLILYDQDAISAARAGRNQLSCGYSCELDPVPGVWNGQRYDAVQKRIRGNHVALVDLGRAGPEARIRLDAAKTAMLAFTPSRASTPNRESTMPQIRIDGTSIDISEQNAPAIQQLVDRAIASVKKDGADAAASEKARADKAEGKLAIVKANVASLKKRADEMKAKMVPCDACDGSGRMMGEEGESEGCDYCDGKGSFRLHEAIGMHGMAKEAGADDAEMDVNELEVEQQTENEAKAAHADAKAIEVHVAKQKAFRAKLDKMSERRLDRRAKLLDVAKRALGADWSTEGKGAVDIKRAIVAKIEPSAKADKLDGGVLEGEFRAAVRKLDAAPTQADLARGATAGAQGAAPRVDAQSARAKMMQANQDAWKRPAAAK